MALDAAAILKLAPFATAQLKKYLRGDLARSLDRRVRAEFENDPELGPQVTEALINQWLYIHGDPHGAVVIAGLLDHGDLVYLDALRDRAGQILDGLETLPWDVPATVDRLVAAVRNNFVAAQKDAENATQRGTSAVLSALDPLASKSDLDQLGDRLERALTPPPAPVLLLPASFDEDQQRHLKELKALNLSAAGRLGEVLDAGGVDGLVGLIGSPPPWAAHQPAAFWEAAGRVLVDAGRLADAERAFLTAAARPDIADRAEALIDAARCAELEKRFDAADRHFAEAESMMAEHPSVLLFAASRAPAEDRLALIEAIDPATPRQKARKEVHRALTLLALERFGDARAAAAASLAANPHGGGEELASLTTIIEAHHRLPMRDRDDRPLIDAVQYQLSLHRKALETGQLRMAAVAGARAALGTAVLGDRAAAHELIDRFADASEVLSDDEARSTLIEAALTSADAERARRLLPARDDTPESRLLHASVAVLAGDERLSVARELDDLLSSLEPGPTRTQAIVMRFLVADDPEVALDVHLAEGIEEGDQLVAHAQAARAISAGDLARARAEVAGFDDLASLSLRSEIAERDGKLPEAISVQAALTRKQPTAANALRLAALRARVGDFPGAIRDAMRLATDNRKLRSARDAAYGLAAQAAMDAGDYDELEDIADRWAELSPERQDPLWAQTFALARQNRHPDALAFARKVRLEPIDEANRHLLFAELYMHGLSDGGERMRALMELSDRFDRPQELEKAFIGGVLKTPSTDRPDDPEVIARFQDAISTFEDRFPGAGGLTKVQIDDADDGEAIIEKLAAIQPTGTQEEANARQDAIDGVRQGRVPIAFLAAMVGRSTAETIIRNGAHPLAVFDQATHDAEVAAAELALDEAAASWDETACVTVGQLAEAHGRLLLSALPGSRIGQGVRDSLSEAVKLQMGGEQVAVMQILPDGTPRIIEENPETVARVRDVQVAADQVAGRLTVAPDRVGGDDRLAEVVSDDRVHGPLGAIASSLLIAREAGLPLYSDDRVARAYARSFGLSAFGTIALIDAAARRGLIAVAEDASILQAVVDLGVWGLPLQPAAYVDVARRAAFDVNRCVRPLLADEALLRVEPRFVHNAHLLAAVAEEAPPLLEGWAAAIVDSYRQMLELEPLVVTSLLIASQLNPDREEVSDAMRSRNMMVVSALRGVDGVDPAEPGGDPLVGAVGRWLHAIEDPAMRASALERLLTQVDVGSAELLRTVFAESGRD
jgi:tetratricopeptide (TPR) repeat protein